MAYIVQNGKFVWAGPGPEPMIGETKEAFETRAVQPSLPVMFPQNGLPTVVQPGAIVGPEPVVPTGGEPWIWPLILGGLGWLIGAVWPDGNGNGNGAPPQLGNGEYPQLGAGPGPKGEAFLDWGGTGGHGREGRIAPGRTTDGTGWIHAETFRAWDPLKQRYYQLEGAEAYSDITFTPGKAAPDGGTIVKAWVTHAWRKDNSLASTQFARLANGRIMSMSEEGIIKSWRPVKNIVMARGKTTLSQAVTAQRYLDKLWRKVARKTKQLKLA